MATTYDWSQRKIMVPEKEEIALSTNDLSNLTEEKLENLGLKTGKIISTSQEARKSNK